MARTSNLFPWMIDSIDSICSGTNGRPKCRSETWKTVSIRMPRGSGERSDDGVGELRRRGRAAEIARDGLPLANHTLHPVADALRPRAIVEMLEHEACGVHECPGIRDALPRYVRRGAVHSLEDRRVLPEIGAGREPEPADESRDEI